MTRREKAENIYTETANALKMVYDSLNEGQKKKLEKDENVKKLLSHYGII